MNLLSFLISRYAVIIPFLLLISCNKKWDPDQQFNQQSEKIRLEQENFQLKMRQEAMINLREFESEILLGVKSGISNQNFNNLVGFKYSILASNITVGKHWERRLYKWDEIVESKWSLNSLEYQLCEKNRDFFIITINQINVTAVEYL
jgi:hypothetical protein